MLVTDKSYVYIPMMASTSTSSTPAAANRTTVLETDFPISDNVRANRNSRMSIGSNLSYGRVPSANAVPPPYTTTRSTGITATAPDWQYQAYNRSQSYQQASTRNPVYPLSSATRPQSIDLRQQQQLDTSTTGRTGSLRRAYNNGSDTSSVDAAAAVAAANGDEEERVPLCGKKDAAEIQRPSPQRSHVSSTSDYHSEGVQQQQQTGTQSGTSTVVRKRSTLKR